MCPHTFVFAGHSYAQAGLIGVWKDPIKKNNVHIKDSLNFLELMEELKGPWITDTTSCVSGTGEVPSSPCVGPRAGIELSNKCPAER